MQPFLKWAGGKRWLRAEIKARASIGKTGRYIEPFLGSGASFFHLKPERAILADVNRDLINTYVAIQQRPDLVERYLKEYSREHSDDFYYRVRNRKPASLFRAAAHFLYLNRTCWNGLYRVNKSGVFNVPRGTKDRIIFEGESFESISKALSGAEILCCDFEAVIDRSESGDFLYCDPPYTVHHNMNGFLKYNETIFSWDDQVRLRDAVQRASGRGVKVMVSNACHESVIDLYDAIAEVSVVSRKSVISGISKGRGRYDEIVVEMG